MDYSVISYISFNDEIINNSSSIFDIPFGINYLQTSGKFFFIIFNNFILFSLVINDDDDYRVDLEIGYSDISYPSEFGLFNWINFQISIFNPLGKWNIYGQAI